MTPEQATALIVALTGLIGALGVLFVQIARIRRDINGRMAELGSGFHAALVGSWWSYPATT